MSELDDDYAKAGFNGALEFGHSPALLIVDVVNAYIEASSPLYAGPSAVTALENNIQLRDAAHQANIPVILTNVLYDESGLNGGMFYKKVPVLEIYKAGNPLADFPDGLQPAATDIVITKQYPSAYFGTSLASMLTALGVDTVMVTGYSTSGCVRASVLDTLQFGFAPFVITDACADRAPEPHNANLFDMTAKYAEGLTTAQAIDRLKELENY